MITRQKPTKKTGDRRARLVLSILCACFITFVSLAHSDSAFEAPASPSKTVLLLFPYQADLPHHISAMQAIHDEFNTAGDIDLKLYVEYLDLNRFADAAYQAQLFNLLVTKYRDKPLSLIHI